MPEQPNILIIWGDDIGISNLSCYSDGLMGCRTPNIDRIAAEGARFTDYYGEQSCTAGRAAFITGQNPYRTGLTKVGMPGADVGLRAEDPTIATALKALGSTTGLRRKHAPDAARVSAAAGAGQLQCRQGHGGAPGWGHQFLTDRRTSTSPAASRARTVARHTNGQHHGIA
jgi:arylsulfatase A-like enzyme